MQRSVAVPQCYACLPFRLPLTLPPPSPGPRLAVLHRAAYGCMILLSLTHACTHVRTCRHFPEGGGVNYPIGGIGRIGEMLAEGTRGT